MSSLLKKMRGDKKGWYKVSDLKPGLEVAVPSKSGEMIWDEIVSIKPAGREQVYDIEVEGTHNFIGNGIFAHNTYVLRANTMLAVEGIVVPMPKLPSPSALPSASSTLIAEIPPEVLTADGKGVDLYKLATYNLSGVQALAEKVDAQDTRMTSLETRVEALESGAVSSGGSLTSTSSGSLTSSLASAFESFGVFIQKGIAQFGMLVADQFVAATNSAGTSSAGTVTILAGNTVAQVTNAYVKPSSKVFVTFTASTTGSWYISDKQNGSFKLVLENAQVADASFDYFLVQTEGQMATSTPEVDGSQTSQGGLTSPDRTAPVITLLGDNPLRLSIGGVFVEPGVTVTDNVDPSAAFGAGGTLPVVTYVNGLLQEASASTITTTSPTTYIITYSATDKAGNNATITRAVIVGDSEVANSGGETPESDLGVSPPSSDTTAPVVTLLGDAAMQMATTSTPFADPGATALDDISGDVTASIVVSGTVDTATAGLYTLTYTATDAAGNAGTASRVVTILAPVTP